MAPLRSLVAATLLFLSTANAQFELLLPLPLEGDKMNKDLEPAGPCGGGVPDLSSNTATDFHVDGDSVAIRLGQPQANIMIGATLDSHAASNWTALFPIVKQSGQGNFCEPAITVPKEWAGKKGFIGVVSKTSDAERYQCAAVNFVSGAKKTVSSTCNNGTGVSASFTSDLTLSGMVGSPSNSGASLLLRGSGLPVGSFAVIAGMILAGAAVL
ncbi:hypothetical protein C8A01DRAFT_21017 [Parachaetomium inaequale]|uniref:Copper acquisition factor BIM1-like domain-containing protein n=1 Tax=Parachaetomium inaequale TaxID=2588326 RepID=A0AAN6P572_9PEZI|nr:hypothetical protein C8A01DRAFT_21017 [Parachaetomium inaequale]